MNKREMDPALRVVTQMPLTELWGQDGPVAGHRGKLLTTHDLRRRLREGPVRFVVAEVGDALRWVPANACYDFWKSELKDRIVDTEKFHLEDFPGTYCYVASEWILDGGGSVVLLETHH